ncbi:MAG: pyridoxamine 5'-phosphate oxidase family protein [Bacteroidota bacterium]
MTQANQEELKNAISHLIDHTDSKVNPFSLSTLTLDGYPAVRMMGIFFRDGLELYLNSQAPSGKLEQIKQNPKVSLFFHAPDYSEMITYFGQANLVEDPTERAWAWERFPEAIKRYHTGPDSEKLAIIRIRPDRIEWTDRKTVSTFRP